MLATPKIDVKPGQTVLLRGESVYPDLEAEVLSCREDGGMQVKQVFSNGGYSEPFFAWRAEVVRVLAGA